MTKDQYVLTVHRVLPKTRPPGGPPVYLHHGLLMCSEIWVTMADSSHNLPLLLCDLGYDVWVGNNRGNKYLQKHMARHPNSAAFWDFSIDEFALFDVPAAVQHILEVSDHEKVAYIGFSQGSAQGFAALSAAPELRGRVSCMAALSPALTPRGLHNSVVDLLMKASPALMFLFFGRTALLPSAAFWRRTVYPPLFTKVIDLCNGSLFNWSGSNIDADQKMLSYAHLYLATSVKTVVHWFQIIRSGVFQMYDAGGWTVDRTVPRYPTKHIEVPILLVYGGSDSLVDINVMRSQLPIGTKTIEISGYEHLDILWGSRAGKDVFPPVVEFLKENFIEIKH